MIKLARPYIPEKAIEKAAEVLRSGNLVQGKYVKEFENSICNYLKIKNAVVVSSGTAALHLSLLALGIKRGDEVIVPAFTFPATANVVELVGAKPVFVDINLSDFCIDTAKIEEKITSKTKAIIPVHEFGQSAKLDDIMNIAQKYNLKIIEDAACALGAEFEHQKVGTFGELGCFSFHPRKAITTGEGGVIVTNNDKLAEKLKILRNHGISYKDGKVDFVEAGLNYRMTDFQAVLGIEQLLEIDNIIEQRIKIANLYNEKLSSIDKIKIPHNFKNRKAVYQTYHILVNDVINRDNLIMKLKENGIETNLGAQALPCLTYYKNKYNLKERDFPNAVKAYKQGLTLPMGDHINNENINVITEKLIIDY
ncbi:aminotransferase class I/II-fold pyridoxal phosphate-dependent enzyme [bacterium]|nr:MAG: aminotransferase class I/II-fold pyridoxal phosphate-dependent enzyme [bacterium]